MDRHVSNCITTFVNKHKLRRLAGGVTYASSRSLVVVQAADLIAGAFRIYHEGGHHLSDWMTEALAPSHRAPGKDALGKPIESVVQLF